VTYSNKIAVCLLIAASCPTRALCDPLYSVVDLTRAAGGDSSFVPVALNDLGQVAGTINSSILPYPQVGLYSNGTVTTQYGPGFAEMDVNNSGVMVGLIDPAAGNYPTLAVLKNGNLQTLGSLPEYQGQVTSIAINNSGQIVGTVMFDGGSHGFLYSKGQLTDFSAFDGGVSGANAINNAGQIVGSEFLNAALFSNGKITTLAPSLSVAMDINDQGQVAINEYINNVAQAFVYQDGQLHQLGDIGAANVTWASALNDAGEVVGYAGSRAFLYSGGQMEDLDSLIDPALHLNLTAAVDINNLGQILADSGGIGRPDEYYLLTPIDGRPVPEPGTALTCALPLLAVLWTRRHSIFPRVV
jgi:probable HAF family extracellular repeat protein